MTTNNPRFVSLLTRETLALVLAGGRGSRLYELTDRGPNLPFISVENSALSTSRYPIASILASAGLGC